MNLTLGQCATFACLLEATAPKPGNVHRGADFEDLTYFDFAASAVAIAPAIEAAPTRSLGETVLAAVHATRQAVGTNTNLGTVLLLTPLAMVPVTTGECVECRAGLALPDVLLAGDRQGKPCPTGIADLRSGVADVLARLTPDDAQEVYAAIRLAQPGGLGRVEEADIAGDAPSNLLAAMRLAAHRDLVTAQYANNFEQVLTCVVPWLEAALQSGLPLSDAIVHTHLRLMSEYPDSLIARKCGQAVAQQAADHAAEVLAAGPPASEAYRQALADLDFWLRSDHHRRNPGTSADLIAAGLFVALRQGIIQPPFRM